MSAPPTQSQRTRSSDEEMVTEFEDTPMTDPEVRDTEAFTQRLERLTSLPPVASRQSQAPPSAEDSDTTDLDVEPREDEAEARLSRPTSIPLAAPQHSQYPSDADDADISDLENSDSDLESGVEAQEDRVEVSLRGRELHRYQSQIPYQALRSVLPTSPTEMPSMIVQVGLTLPVSTGRDDDGHLSAIPEQYSDEKREERADAQMKEQERRRNERDKRRANIPRVNTQLSNSFADSARSYRTVAFQSPGSTTPTTAPRRRRGSLNSTHSVSSRSDHSVRSPGSPVPDSPGFLFGGMSPPPGLEDDDDAVSCASPTSSGWSPQLDRKRRRSFRIVGPPDSPTFIRSPGTPRAIPSDYLTWTSSKYGHSHENDDKPLKEDLSYGRDWPADTGDTAHYRGKSRGDGMS